MKKKILLSLFLLVVCFGFGCNHEESNYDHSKTNLFEIGLSDGFIISNYHSLGPSNGVDMSLISGDYDIVAHDVVITSNPWLVYFIPKMDDETLIEDKGIEVWKSLDDFESGKNPDFVCETGEVYEDENNKFYDTYLLKDLSYQNIVDEVFAVPYYIKNGTKIIGMIDKYSMLQYCHDFYNCQEYYDENGIITVSEMIKAALNYATVCQKFFGYKLDHLASNEIFKYGIAYIKDTSIVFYSYGEIDKYFSNPENDVQNIDIVLDFPVDSGISITIMEWTHKVNIDVPCELSIDYLYIYGSDVTINNANVNKIYSENANLTLNNCVIRDTNNKVGTLEFNECILNSVKLDRLNKTTFNDCTITPNENTNISILDCNVVYFNNCIIRNTNLYFRDAYFYEGNESIVEFNTCNVESVSFGGEFINKSYIYIKGEGIYRNTKFNLLSKRSLYILDGYFDRNVSLSNAVLSGGYFFEVTQGKNGVMCAEGYIIQFSKLENAYGRYYFSCVAR